MPFTPAHAAAVLPLLRTPLPASALVIGSLAPDLPYYTPAGTSWPTHTALAVVTTDLAIGAAAWALWHVLLAPAALAAAPRGVRQRLAGRVVPGLRRRLGSPAAIGWVLLALVVGAATHVGWDELSHPGRWGTAHLAVLRDPVATTLGVDAGMGVGTDAGWPGAALMGWEGYRWVQYASGALGLAVLAGWGLRWWQRTPSVALLAPEPRGPWGLPVAVWVWPGLLVIAATAGLVAAALAPSLRTAAFAGATVGGGAGMVAFAAGALVWRCGWLRPRRRVPRDTPGWRRRASTVEAVQWRFGRPSGVRRASDGHLYGQVSGQASDADTHPLQVDPERVTDPPQD